MSIGRIIEGIDKKINEEAAKQEITQELVDSIDIKPLEDTLSKMLGTNVMPLDKSAKDNKYFIVDGKDLSAEAGVMSYAFPSIKIRGTGSIGDDNGIAYLWLPIKVNWTVVSGGTNGTSILTSWYNMDTKEWTFKDVDGKVI